MYQLQGCSVVKSRFRSSVSSGCSWDSSCSLIKASTSMVSIREMLPNISHPWWWMPQSPVSTVPYLLADMKSKFWQEQIEKLSHFIWFSSPPYSDKTKFTLSFHMYGKSLFNRKIIPLTVYKGAQGLHTLTKSRDNRAGRLTVKQVWQSDNQRDR